MLLVRDMGLSLNHDEIGGSTIVQAIVRTLGAECFVKSEGVGSLHSVLINSNNLLENVGPPSHDLFA